MTENKVTILTCIPVNWDQYTDRVKEEMMRLGYVEGKPKYMNSIKGSCDECSTEVFIGPSQQDLLPCKILCVTCAVTLMNNHPDQSRIRCLGNDNTITGNN